MLGPEYAKINTGALGNQAPTDSARHEIDGILSAYSSKEQFKRALQVLDVDAGNRTKALEDEHARLMGSIRGGNVLATPPSGPNQSSPSPQNRKPYAPGVPFDVTPGQYATFQKVKGVGAPGSVHNPIFMNPKDPGSSWANAKPGQYLVLPDGRPAQKP